jgi:hypothetical protein
LPQWRFWLIPSPISAANWVELRITKKEKKKKKRKKKKKDWGG